MVRAGSLIRGKYLNICELYGIKERAVDSKDQVTTPESRSLFRLQGNVVKSNV